MLKRLVESSHQSGQYAHSVISLTNTGVIGEKLIAHGIDVKSLEMTSIFSLPRIMWCLVLSIKSFNPDIVQTWMYHADLIGGIASRLAGKKYIIWGIRTTQLNNSGAKTTPFIRHICAFLSSWLPHTIVCAAEASKTHHIELGYDASKMVVIPNGFEMSHFKPNNHLRNDMRTRCGFDEHNIVIGSIGRFNYDKDYACFIQTAANLSKQYSSIRFLLVGQGLSSDNMELIRLIKQTGYVTRFTLLGERSDIPVCLSTIDIFCLHSRTEGFPNVLGEAMAMGVPCVATDVGDTAMLLKDTGCILVKKENTIELADGIKKMLGLTFNERQVIGTNARQRISQLFSMDQCRSKYEAIYTRVRNS